MLAGIGIFKAGKGTETNNTFTGFAHKGFSLVHRLLAKPAQVMHHAIQVFWVAVQVLCLAIPARGLAKPCLHAHVKQLGNPGLQPNLPGAL